LIGLKTATDTLKENLLTNMSERAALMRKEDLESLGPTKINEVEKTQQKIIAVCKKLEEDGKLVIGDGADTLV
jgi:flagellar motor switch protein FliG